jgi:hypothetical protein
MQNKSNGTDTQNGAKNDPVPADNATKVTMFTLVFSALAVTGLASRIFTTSSDGWRGTLEVTLLWISVVVFLLLFIVRLLQFRQNKKID